MPLLRPGRGAARSACGVAHRKIGTFPTAAYRTIPGVQPTTKARGGQDKGQRAEMEAFVEAVRTGGPMPIGADSLLATTRATIAAGESLLSGRPERV